MSTASCISCGMPMRTTEEHAAGDLSKPYCHHCARPDGQMKTYDEVLTGFAAFLRQTQGIEDKAAQELARGLMSKLPAWAGA